MLPVFLGVAALGIDVSYYGLTKLELQRSADAAALAGAVNYSAINNIRAAVAYAANMAELNGGAGGTQVWNAAALTLTDGQISVKFVDGIVSAADWAVQVTIGQSAPLMFARVLSTQSSVPISATAWGEIGAGRGPQPCVLALAGDGTSVTAGVDVALSGNAVVVLNNCTVRSDASITVAGNASVTAQAGIYAAGTIGITGNGTNNSSPEYPHSGKIPDPYANDLALQSALAQLGSGGQTQPATATLNPGTYASLDFKTAVSLAPGLYLVNGPISFEANASVTGTGVTIISSGSVSINGSANVNLTAPSASTATGGAVPAILYANPTVNQSLQWNGASNETLTGLFYTPNSTLTISGNAGAGTNGCLMLIAAKVDIKGSSSLSGNCASLGARSFGSQPGAAVLVQ